MFFFFKDEAERPAFKGDFQRSITNDDLNEEYYSPFRRKMKMLFAVFVSFSIIGIVITLVFIIFSFKSSLIVCVQEGRCENLKNPVLNANTIPAILNAV